MRKILLLLSILVITGCGGTSPMKHKPSPIGLVDAIGVIEKLTMTQHPTWRPDYIDITNQYIHLGYGTRSSGRGSATVIGNTVSGSGSSTSRAVGERLYYESVHGIQLMAWHKKRQWFVVSIRGADNAHAGYIFRTLDLASAKHFVDAMSAVVAYYQKDPEKGLGLPEPRSYVVVEFADENINADEYAVDESDSGNGVYNELIKLDELRERGILTDAEFEAEKKKVLEGD